MPRILPRVSLIALLATTLVACDKQITIVMSQAETPATVETAATQEPLVTAVEEAPAAAPLFAQVNQQRLIAADKEPGNWMSYGRTYSEQRFSPLQQVTADNVAGLGLDWSFELKTERGIEATSIVVDGIMYMTSSWSIVHALDARNGEHLWTFDPMVPKEKAKHTCCDVVNRGVAVWEGQVFFGALDGRLFALDAATGEVNWEVATFDPKLSHTITGAPRVVKDKVLIGNGGAEFGVRGFISAYNVSDGSLAWRFYTVPGNPELGFESDALKMAADTWNGNWWEIGGGGGTVWDAMAYDPELDLLYFGVGNGTPWNREIRSPGGGDNLFLSSVVAVRPDTGEYVWHYQTTPGESWDYTATQHIILADIEFGGKLRKVLMQAPKNGFFYVLDRTNGELLSANNYINITWATHVDMETGRPVEVPGARYENKPFLMYPSYLGGHNWHPMSYNPQTGLVYIPVLDIPATYAQPENFKYNAGVTNIGIDNVIGGLPDDQAERDAMGALVARLPPPATWYSRAPPTATWWPTVQTMAKSCGNSPPRPEWWRHPYPMRSTASNIFRLTWVGVASLRWCSVNLYKTKACPMSAVYSPSNWVPTVHYPKWPGSQPWHSTRRSRRPVRKQWPWASLHTRKSAWAATASMPSPGY
jgi:PQQ-dependent dehydrogenase (methanol/ethanol family)